MPPASWSLFRPSPASAAADRILAAVTDASRDPALFGEGRAPDTLDGRFEMATVFASLAIHRLRQSPEGERVGQIFADRLFRLFDAGLREAGVGDLTVPKRMKKLAAAFYGRLQAYAAALDAAEQLAAALSRNIWGVDAHAFAPVLAERVAAQWRRLREVAPAQLEEAGTWR